MSSIKESEYRILFQNGDGDINLGVWLNDPDINSNDIIWYNVLSSEIYNSFFNNEGLTTVNEEYGTASCYVELHRESF